nr:hypothetical protein [Prochlorococcus marinus]
MKLIPINYKIKKKDGLNELIIDFKITNTSKTKETMVSNINFELDFFKSKGNEYCQNLNYQEDIYIYDNNKIKNLNNYWPTTIIKSNSELFVRSIYKFNNNNFREKIKYLWIKVFWDNYGHFGISKNKDCLLINLDCQKKRPKEVFEISINNKYNAFAIKTDLLGCFDDPVNTLIAYCKGIVEKNDILTIGESPLAIMQNRYIDPQNLEYSLFSKTLCYFFHPTSSLATACGMQLLINRIGITRITFALIIGFLFKLVGIKGMFYRLTGSESSLIDDISGTVTPYDKSIVMGPLNADLFCKEVSQYLNIDVAVVDVNDLGGVKVLASSNKAVNEILKRNLISNPAGNGDEKTPIVIVREKSK